MKEILEEICSKIINPLNDQVYYKYVEQSYSEIWHTEYHFLIVEMKKATGSVSSIIFRQSVSISKEQERTAVALDIDLLDKYRKRLIAEVFKYGVISALESSKKVQA